MTNIINNLDTLTIEGHSFKELLIDALVGAGLPTIAFAQWAEGNGLARANGNQHNENWVWVRERLDVLEMDALIALYSRVKKL